MTDTTGESVQNRFYQYALWLAVFTIVYNLLEGLASVYFGAHDETLTLFGFGLDSFIEVVSGIGILLMVLRIREHPDTARSRPERTALRVTGASFYVLAAGLLATAIYNLATSHKPATTLSGLIISLISMTVMWILVAAKRRVGHTLDSEPILADANCSVVCIYMSLVLLIASLIYRLTGLGFVDSLGVLGLIYYSVQEGREAYEKASELLEDSQAAKGYRA